VLIEKSLLRNANPLSALKIYILLTRLGLGG